MTNTADPLLGKVTLSDRAELDRIRLAVAVNEDGTDAFTGDPVQTVSDARLGRVTKSDNGDLDRIPVTVLVDPTTGDPVNLGTDITETIALSDLSDVSAKTGAGSTVVMSTGPTISSPSLTGVTTVGQVAGATEGTTTDPLYIGTDADTGTYFPTDAIGQVVNGLEITRTNGVGLKIDPAGVSGGAGVALDVTGDATVSASMSAASVIVSGATASKGLATNASKQLVSVNEKTLLVLTGDVAISAGAADLLTNITGLSFSVTSGRHYWFRCFIDFTTGAATTGSRWTINGPGMTRLFYKSEYTLTNATVTTNVHLITIQQPAASNASSNATSGGANYALIEGFFTPSGNGTLQIQGAREVNTDTVTAKAGSWLEYYEQT